MAALNGMFSITEIGKNREKIEKIQIKETPFGIIDK